MSFFGMLSVFAICGSMLAIAMMVLVSMPQSPLRNLLVQLFGWTFAALCALYCLSPVDLLPEAIFGPFGIPDDIGAAVAGALSAITAWRVGKSPSSSDA